MEVTNSRVKEEIVECEDLIIPDLIIPEQVSEYDTGGPQIVRFHLVRSPV